MAVQFAPREGSFGSSIGGALGSAVGGGISSLIEKKIADLKKRSGVEERKTTYKNLGLPEWIGELPDELQQTLLKEYEFAPQQEKQMMNQQLEQIGQQYWTAQAEQQQMPRAPMGEETPEYTQAPAEDFGKYESKIPGLNTILSAGKGIQVSPQAKAEVQAFPERGHGTIGQPGPTEAMQPAYKEPKITEGPKLWKKGAKAISINPEIELEKLKRQSYKETKGERENFLKDYQESKRDIDDFKRMRELENEGKLNTPGYLEFLKRAGLDMPALMNEGSEEFKKLEANFLRNAKQYYGGRVTNQEMEQFLKTIPSLSQSPEGRKRVIANLENLARVKMERYQAYKDIKTQYKGVIPPDISELVEERLDKKLDNLATQFRKDLARPVPKAQNKLVTALQAGLGNVVGSLGGSAKGAAKGAVIGAGYGALGGPVGAGGGAALGALGGLTGLI